MERERITISIKKKLLDSIDKTIDGVNIRNRSHAIETLASASLGISDAKNIVVLIGGRDALKSIPAAEKTLSSLSEQGFSKVYIAVGFLADKIKEKLGDGSEFGLKLQYVTEGEGSGGAILPLKKHFDKTFIVINSRQESTVNLEKITDFHKYHNSVATVATNNIEELEGIYVFEPEIFSYISKGFSMLEGDIFPKLIEENKLVVLPLKNN